KPELSRAQIGTQGIGIWACETKSVLLPSSSAPTEVSRAPTSGGSTRCEATRSHSEKARLISSLISSPSHGGYWITMVCRNRQWIDQRLNQRFFGAFHSRCPRHVSS